MNKKNFSFILLLGTFLISTLITVISGQNNVQNNGQVRATGCGYAICPTPIPTAVLSCVVNRITIPNSQSRCIDTLHSYRCSNGTATLDATCQSTAHCVPTTDGLSTGCLPNSSPTVGASCLVNGITIPDRQSRCIDTLHSARCTNGTPSLDATCASTAHCVLTSDGLSTGCVGN